MALRLKGSTSGSVELDVPAAVSGGDVSLTLPNGTGSANQFVKNGSAAGTLEYSSLIEDGSGNITATGGGTFGGAMSFSGGNGLTTDHSVGIRASGSGLMDLRRDDSDQAFAIYNGGDSSTHRKVLIKGNGAAAFAGGAIDFGSSGTGTFAQRVKTGHAAVSGTSIDYGITAYANRTSTGNTAAVFAQNYNSGGRNFAGVNSSGTTTCSILGNGNATFAGALSKGSGSFKISHPLPAKSETHHLVHSFIEGPQADLIYRGYVDLVDGQATVNIDTAGRMSEGTFEVLCTNVSCFTSNESDWIAVKGSVTGNVLTIAAQDATATSKVSWMVVGERKDQHMIDTDWTDAAGRVITEPEKVVEAVEETEE